MNRLSFFLAYRTLCANAYTQTFSTLSIICFAGIFIGSFSLAIVSAIMRGFEDTIHSKIQGVHAHIIIDAYGKPINFKALSRVLHKDFPEIQSFSPHTERNALVRPIKETAGTPTVVIIKSINPSQEKETSTLFTKIINPEIKTEPDLYVSDNSVMVGKYYAASHHITVGDEIEFLFPREEKIQGKTVTFDSEKALVGAIFDTGIDEFDSNVIYCSFAFLKNIFPQASVEQVHLKINSKTDEKTLIQSLRSRLGLSVYSWKDLYPSLVATLQLEKYVSFFVIALIVLVASLNIISLMHMYITQKRHTIALLKSLGMKNAAICSIFFIIGLTLTLSASTLGLLTACIVGHYIKQYPFITLPDTYYATHLPIMMEPWIIISVFCVVLVCCLLAIICSVKQVYSINTSTVLRFED